MNLWEVSLLVKVNGGYLSKDKIISIAFENVAVIKVCVLIAKDDVTGNSKQL
ncbi:hypothetical protein SCORR_v1c04060 [Spiroplasma corruscae]|uniref:Uncharacterized protein n=1 Tax=Spiroplasma corruscae TaxID=216934 RepID=A0A222ENV1_9MOLU|nr:hypothetical protein [Spiroplasma corruscae]ASP28180.1 hypothetical protein SCORR_v1c04060 [Spiroplasma corruscae]